MFCQTCGAEVGDGVAPCSGCGTAVVRTAAATSFGQRVKTASRDAVSAFKVIAKDPLGGLPQVFNELGDARATGAGIVFAAAFDLCVIVGLYLALPVWSRPEGAGGLVKLFVFGAVPFVSVVGALALTRKLFRGAGSLGGDAFVAGASLLPFGLLALAAGVLGLGNVEVIVLLSILALTTSVLLLFSGCARVAKLTEPRIVLALPVIIIVGSWFTKIFYAMLL